MIKQEFGYIRQGANSLVKYYVESLDEFDIEDFNKILEKSSEDSWENEQDEYSEKEEKKYSAEKVSNTYINKEILRTKTDELVKNNPPPSDNTQTDEEESTNNNSIPSDNTQTDEEESTNNNTTSLNSPQIDEEGMREIVQETIEEKFPFLLESIENDGDESIKIQRLKATLLIQNETINKIKLENKNFEKSLKKLEKDTKKIDDIYKKLRENNVDFVALSEIDYNEIHKQIKVRYDKDDKNTQKEKDEMYKKVLPKKGNKQMEQIINMYRENKPLAIGAGVALLVIFFSFISHKTVKKVEEKEVLVPMSIITKNKYDVFCDNINYKATLQASTKLDGTFNKTKHIFNFTTKVDGKKAECYIDENSISKKS